MPRAFTQKESERIRLRLLEVGREHLSKTGFRKTTVSALARGAGISKGGFYLFYESKEALWMTLLKSAETELREQLNAIAADDSQEGVGCLEKILRAIFSAVVDHPMLRALSDPDDMAWLLRALPEGAFEEARRDDDQFFSDLLKKLKARGAASSNASATTFAALPAAALALVQGRGLIGEDRFEDLVDFEIEAWTARLAPP